MKQAFIENPLDLAKQMAEDLVVSGALDEFAFNDQESGGLVGLDHYAAEAGYLNQQYFVDSGRSILLPVTFEADEPLSTTQFQRLHFSGEFVTHSTVRLGRSLGGQSMRALCLTFNNVTLLPYMDTIPDDVLLHVPALAINNMDKITS